MHAFTGKFASPRKGNGAAVGLQYMAGAGDAEMSEALFESVFKQAELRRQGTIQPGRIDPSWKVGQTGDTVAETDVGKTAGQLFGHLLFMAVVAMGKLGDDTDAGNALPAHGVGSRVNLPRIGVAENLAAMVDGPIKEPGRAALGEKVGIQARSGLQQHADGLKGAGDNGVGAEGAAQVNPSQFAAVTRHQMLQQGDDDIGEMSLVDADLMFCHQDVAIKQHAIGMGSADIYPDHHACTFPFSESKEEKFNSTHHSAAAWFVIENPSPPASFVNFCNPMYNALGHPQPILPVTGHVHAHTETDQRVRRGGTPAVQL